MVPSSSLQKDCNSLRAQGYHFYFPLPLPLPPSVAHTKSPPPPQIPASCPLTGKIILVRAPIAKCFLTPANLRPCPPKDSITRWRCKIPKTLQKTNRKGSSNLTSSC